MTRPNCLFELSWEVCNKVGGIYTVVMSKAALLVEKMNKYFLIGPYFAEKAKLDLEELDPPEEFKQVFAELEHEGITCHYGKWLVKGEPRCILIDTSQFHKKNEIKSLLWEKFKIDSLAAGWDFEEPMLWSWAAGILLEKLTKCETCATCNVIAHFHEWLAGFGLLYLKMQNANITTVFTTHATTLGRTLAGSGRNLYEELEAIDPNKEAQNYQIQAKHLTELACAENSTVFTTVSETTALEAEHFLKRKPDVLLLNGLDISKFPTMEEASIKHRKNRETIREFCSYFFLPHYFFDTDKTLFFFIVGRYELRNKGIDVFMDALARLNDRLKKENFDKTIIAFYWIPRDVQQTKIEISLSKIAYDNIQHYISENSKLLQQTILNKTLLCNEASCFTTEDALTKGQLFDKSFLYELKKLRFAFSKPGLPPLSTHNLPNEPFDPIINRLTQIGLDNKEDDKVKVVFYPVYLTGVDGLLDLPYYEAIMGCHLGLFPSYYEPWGYTPLETAALGVPALTTDLAGFGRFLQSQKVGDKGIYILNRFKKPRDEIINQFTQILYDYVHMNSPQRVQQKITAKRLAALADWSMLINNYLQAYDLAVKRKWN
jgi:glycogen(starch) synthase